MEQKRTLAQMRELLAAYDASDLTAQQVHLRQGLVKDVLEEYEPLTTLVAYLPNALTARLMPDAHPGPDAIIEIAGPAGPQDLAVQITVADQSEQTRLDRARMAQGQIAFPARHKARAPQNKAVILETGRAGENPMARRNARLDAIVARIVAKINQHYAGTQALLVVWRNMLGMNPQGAVDWRVELRARVAGISPNPYSRIYLCSDSEIVDLLASA